MAWSRLTQARKEGAALGSWPGRQRGVPQALGPFCQGVSWLLTVAWDALNSAIAVDATRAFTSERALTTCSPTSAIQSTAPSTMNVVTSFFAPDVSGRLQVPGWK